MEPFGFFGSKPVRTQIEQNECGDELEGIRVEGRDGEPEIYSGSGEEEQASVEQKTRGH